MNPSGSDVPFAFPPEDCVTIKCERVQRNAFVAPKPQIIGARSNNNLWFSFLSLESSYCKISHGPFIAEIIKSL